MSTTLSGLLLAVTSLAALLGVAVHNSAPVVSSGFGTTTPFVFVGVEMEASVADTPYERQLGLSGTTQLPEHIAKVFIFEESSRWGFWMKDMHYPIDMFWVAGDGSIVHIVPNASPESYPETFTPTEPALYVIETVAGFAEKHHITVGASIDITPFVAKNDN
jgi:uncharacterized membrane protein (UPF0127 family)